MRKLTFARKVWKFFTNTLQSKLHKLNKSKAIKKPPKRRLNQKLQKNQKKLACWPSFSIQSPRKNQKYRFKHTQKLRIHKTKKPSPVYIDQLFLQTASTALVHAQPMQSASGALVSVRPSKKKEPEPEEDREKECSTSNETMESPEEADDMWESLGFESPSTHRINERAEEFIARFRAEMQNEEIFHRR